MPLNSDQEIAALLTRTKTIALQIASPKPQRDSNKVLKFLIDNGFEVYPINPGHAGEMFHDRTVYADLSAVPVQVDLVDIFRRSDCVAPIVGQALDIGAKAIWMQFGVIHPAAATKAEAAGLTVVMDKCPIIEIRKLRRLALM